MKELTLAFMLIVSAGGTAIAQETPTSQPAPAEEHEKKAMPSLIKTLPNYQGDWFEREGMTGDWGGLRTKLADNGLIFDLQYTNSVMGNAYGGRDTSGAIGYSGMADYSIKLDTARMGLWPGGLIVLHGQTNVGRSINGQTGSVMSPNFLALLPVPGDPGVTTLSEYYVMQALSEKFVVALGKMDLTAIADRNEFAGDPTHNTEFSNTAFNVNPILFGGGPYTTLTAAAIWIPTDWLQVASFIAGNNPDGAATTTGFNTAFHSPNWLSVGQEFDFTVKPFGQTGHQRIGWFFTTKDVLEFGSDSREPLPNSGDQRGLGIRPKPFKRLRQITQLAQTVNSVVNPKMSPDNAGMYYNFDQYLFTEREDPKQGWGLFGRFGFAPTDSNFISQFYSIGLGGKGTIPCRDNDTWGLGYYFANASDKIELINVDSEQGVELFYNIEVTKWLYITPDIQCIIDPGVGFRDRDPAIVYGLRAQIKL